MLWQEKGYTIPIWKAKRNIWQAEVKIMGDLIHFPCWMELLIKNKDSEDIPTISILAKDMGITYSHTVNIIKSLSSRAIVETEKNGRTNKVRITLEGRKIGQMLFICKKILKEGEEKGTKCEI